MQEKDGRAGMPSREGTVLGRYTLVRLLGAGGMGSVYEATHRELGRRAAVKTLHDWYSPEPAARQRFLQEGRAAARIRHANVAAVYDVGVEGDHPYLVMELLEGEDLAQFIRREAPLSLEKTADLLVPVVAGVAAAHDQGVLHRDLKPHNIFLCAELAGVRPKVLDFGISKLMSPASTLEPTGPNVLLGTPQYMSPEQARGSKDIDWSSDQYSLGVILYECVTGCRPLQEVPPYALLQRTVEGEFPKPRERVPGLSSAFEALILKAMARGKEARYPTTRAFGAALLEYASDRVRGDYAAEFASDRPLLSAPMALPSSVRVAKEPLGETRSDAVDSTRQAEGHDAASGRESERVHASQEPMQGFGTLRPDVQSRFIRRRGRWWGLLAAAVAACVGATVWRLNARDHFWRNPIAAAHFEHLVDFGGIEQAAAVSRDGKFVAFLSDRDGPTDVWLTQVGTGQFFNMTHGAFPELINPLVRTLGFSPDGALVTFWTRTSNGQEGGKISVWAAPILGGQPRPYLESISEYDWTSDGTRLVYHTQGPGDPTFIREGDEHAEARHIFTAPSGGIHAHFQTWSPDQRFIYFVQGTLPQSLDIWRIQPSGGPAEQITHHDTRVSYPVLWDERTLLYLATDPDGSGPWLQSMDVERRTPHRISSGVDRYTSLARSAGGQRLVATLANPKESLWRLPIGDEPVAFSQATRISLATGRGFSPRLGPGYLLYASAKGSSEGIWKLADGTTTELWSAPGAHVLEGPAIAPDGQRIAFSIEQAGRTRLLVVRADGTDARVVSEALHLQGAPAWAPDGSSLTSAAIDGNDPRLFRIALDGSPPVRLLDEYSTDPLWDPDGRFIVYSGADIGTRFSLKAAAPDGSPSAALRNLTLTRGARRVCFLPGHRGLVVLRGDIQHKNLWLIELDTGNERQLTDLPRDFDVRDFDVAPDGREVVLDRVQELSDIVVIDVPKDD